MLDLKSALDELKLGLEKKQLETITDMVNSRIKDFGNSKTKTSTVIRDAITKHFPEFKQGIVGKGVSFDIEHKAVGNMTIGNNLTGDVVRSYRDRVAMLPQLPLNIEDLVRIIPIATGSYSYGVETGGEGAFGRQTEGQPKNQLDYDLEQRVLNLEYLAGYVTISQQMLQDLFYMESFIPSALRRSYYAVENAEYYQTLKTASTVVTTEGEFVEILIKNQMELLALGYLPNVALVNPANFGTILTTPLGTSGAVTINGSVNFIGGVLNIGGIDVLPANFVHEISR